MKFYLILFLVCVNTYNYQAQFISTGPDTTQLNPLLDSIKIINTLNDYKIYEERIIDIFSELDMDQLPPESKLLWRNIFNWIEYKNRIIVGNLDKRIKFLEKALQLNNNINDLGYSFNLLSPLANIYTRLGDYEKAIYYFKECEKDLIEINSTANLARLYGDFAIALYSKGDTLEAINICQKALSLPDLNIQGKVNNNKHLANYYFESNQFDQSKKHFFKLKKLLPELEKSTRKNPSYYIERLAVSYKLEAKFALHNNNISLAYQLFERWEESLLKAYPNQARREIGKMYNEQAKTYIKFGYLEDADEYLTKAMQTVIAQYDPTEVIPKHHWLYGENTIMEILTTKANYLEELAEKKRDVTFCYDAIKCYKSALKVNNILRDNMAFTGSKLVNLRDNNTLIEGVLSNIIRIQKLENNKNSLLSLADSLFNNSKSVLLKNNRKFVKQFESLPIKTQKEYNIINTKLDSLLRLQQSNESEIIALSDAKNDILNTFKKNIQNRNNKKSNFIDYFWGKQSIFALRNVDDNLSLHQLGTSQTLQNIIDAYSQSFNEQTDNQYNRDLYNFLIKPLLPLPEKIAVVPDNAISKIAFECLYNDKQDSPMLKDHIISYHLDNSLIYNKNKNTRASCYSPAYDPPPSDYALSLLRDQLYELPRALNEAEKISEIINADLFIGQEASKDKFMESISNYGIVNFSGHAVLDNKENTFLAFNSSNDPETHVYLDEIANMQLELNMISLSACNTASGRIEAGEGLYSLARNFHAIGVESVISTINKIPDQSTSEIMISFYKNLKKGQRKDEALRNAKLAYIENADPDYKHPYYWAGIIAIGDMSPLFPKPTQTWKLMALAVCVLLALLFVLRWIKSSRPI